MPKNFNFGASVKLTRPVTDEQKSDNNLKEIVEDTTQKQINKSQEIGKNNEKTIEKNTDSELKAISTVKEKQPAREETRLNGFRLPLALDHQLESYAYHEGINKTDVVIEALKNYFKNKKVDLIPIKKRKKK